MNLATSHEPRKLFFPVIDNGIGISRTSWALSMFAAGVSSLRDYSIEARHISNPYPDGGMNLATWHFIDSGADEMIVIDTDIKFLPSDLTKLLSHDAPFVSGLYTKKMPGMFFVAEPMDNIALPYAQDARPALREFKRVAKGFLRVKREVFEALRPFVAEVPDPRGGTMHEFWKTLPGGHSEDFEFCDKYRAIGGRVMVDVSIILQHEGSALYPILETCRTVKEEAA
jgi:hypothetical protein